MRTGTGFKSGQPGARTPIGVASCKGCSRKRKIVNKTLQLCDNCNKFHPSTRNKPEGT